MFNVFDLFLILKILVGWTFNFIIYFIFLERKTIHLNRRIKINSPDVPSINVRIKEQPSHKFHRRHQTNVNVQCIWFFFFIFSFIVIYTLYFIKFYDQYNISSYEIREIQSVTWNWKTNLNVQCIWFSFLFGILVVWILNFIMYFILLEKYTTHFDKGIEINSTNVLC